MVHNKTQDPRPVIQSELGSDFSESDSSALALPENVSTDWESQLLAGRRRGHLGW